MKKTLVIIFLFPYLFSAQNNTSDSLKLALKNAKHDTTSCDVLEKMIENEDDFNIWAKYNQQLKTITEKHLSESGPIKNIYLKHFSASLNKALAVAESKARPGFPKFGLSTISPKSPLPDPKTSPIFPLASRRAS